MARTLLPPGTRATFWLSVVLAIGLLVPSRLFPPAARAAPAPEQPKAEEKTKAQNARDLKELQAAFGNNPVTIFYGPAASVQGVRLMDVVELFGKQYLRVLQKNGKPMLIRADLITIIRDD